MDTLDRSTMQTSGGFTPNAIEYLNKSAKWMKFFAILLFIYIILIIIGGIMVVGASPYGPAIIIIYIIVGAVVFFPALYLFQSANYFNNYTKQTDEITLEAGLQKHSAYWMFMGVLTIIAIGFFIIALLAGGAAYMGGLAM